MDIPRIIRFLIGLVGAVVTGMLLYSVWWLYGYVHLGKRRKPSPQHVKQPEPPVEERYTPPNFFYDARSGEFYVQQE
jgi:hypothetical protein